MGSRFSRDGKTLAGAGQRRHGCGCGTLATGQPIGQSPSRRAAGQCKCGYVQPGQQDAGHQCEWYGMSVTMNLAAHQPDRSTHPAAPRRPRCDWGGVQPDGRMMASASVGSGSGASPSDSGITCRGTSGHRPAYRRTHPDDEVRRELERHRARTARRWPPPRATARCGCGIRYGQPIGAPPSRATKYDVNGAAFSSHGTTLATADGDGTAAAAEPGHGQPIGSPIQTGVDGSFWCEWGRFRSDSKTLAIASNSDTEAWCGYGTQLPASPSAPDSRQATRTA